MRLQHVVPVARQRVALEVAHAPGDSRPRLPGGDGLSSRPHGSAHCYFFSLLIPPDRKGFSPSMRHLSACCWAHVRRREYFSRAATLSCAGVAWQRREFRQPQPLRRSVGHPPAQDQGDASGI